MPKHQPVEFSAKYPRVDAAPLVREAPVFHILEDNVQVAFNAVYCTQIFNNVRVV